MVMTMNITSTILELHNRQSEEEKTSWEHKNNSCEPSLRHEGKSISLIQYIWPQRSIDAATSSSRHQDWNPKNIVEIFCFDLWIDFDTKLITIALDEKVYIISSK